MKSNESRLVSQPQPPAPTGRFVMVSPANLAKVVHDTDPQVMIVDREMFITALECLQRMNSEWITVTWSGADTMSIPVLDGRQL